MPDRAMLRIGQFTTQYPYPGQFSGDTNYFCSGAERVAQQLSETLVERDHEVTVVTSSKSTRRTATDQNGVTVHRCPSLTAINTTQIAPTLLFDGLHLEFDIVHAHNSTPPGVIAAAVYARAHDVPLVITHHGGEHYESHGSIPRRAGLWAYTRLLMKPLFESVSAVVLPSAGYAQESRVVADLTSAVYAIPNGVDLKTFCSPGELSAKRQLGLAESDRVVLYMGSHHPRKGVGQLLEAFYRFKRTYQAEDTMLILAGSGDLTDELIIDAENSPYADSILFPGYVPESDKATYMNAADCFVLPSTTAGAEMFPLVILEAAAANTPIVASDFPTIRSVLGETDAGQLTDPGDPDAISDAIATLLFDDQSERAQSARDFARNHSWERVCDQYEQLYEIILQS